MRHALFALLLTLIPLPLLAFEIEASRSYAADPSNQNLRILSTADIEVFEPILLAYQDQNPGLTIQYDVASSAQLMQAIYMENAPYDLAISSAMDLQVKLANDGYAQPHNGGVTNTLPDWVHWHNEVFAFTREPTVIVINEPAFAGFDMPTNRAELIQLLRDNPEAFRSRVGTYDVRQSGAGYLFATQDSRNTETYWQLTEIMGRLEAQLYCCSGDMISDVSSGELSIAYNVLGSYANARIADAPNLRAIEMDDYVSVMLRTALVPKNADNPDAAKAMIDFLLSSQGQDLLATVGLPPILTPDDDSPTPTRLIRLGPELLVFLDQMRRDTFLRTWASSMLQD